MLYEIRNFRTCKDKAYGGRPTESDIIEMANIAIKYECICKVVWEEEYIVNMPFNRSRTESELVSFSVYPVDSIENTVNRYKKSIHNWEMGIDNEDDK